MWRRENTSVVDADAARWVARMDRRPFSKEDAAALAAWVAIGPRHAGALARAQAISLTADRVAPQLASVGISVPVLARLAHLRGRWYRVGAIACATVAAVALGANFFLGMRGRVSTDIGEIRLSAMADGSAMTMNTNTVVKVAFNDRVRHVELVAGEALFDVAKNPGRPFVVDAGDVEAVAIGTSFVVQRLPGQPVSVLVRKGVVEVRRREHPLLARLSADQSVAVPVDARYRPEVKILQPEQMSEATAWRQGMVNLDNTSLAAAVREFNRYSKKPLVISDASLAERRLSGVYSVTDPEGFATAAALSLGTSSHADANTIWIGIPGGH